MFHADYMYTGDTKFLRKYYEQLKSKTLIDLASEDGLITTHRPFFTDNLMSQIGFKNKKRRIKDIVDWPKGERDGFQMRRFNTVVNSFHYINLKLMSEIAGVIGKEKDAIFFSKTINLSKEYHQ